MLNSGAMTAKDVMHPYKMYNMDITIRLAQLDDSPDSLLLFPEFNNNDSRLILDTAWYTDPAGRSGPQPKRGDVNAALSKFLSPDLVANAANAMKLAKSAYDASPLSDISGNVLDIAKVLKSPGFNYSGITDEYDTAFSTKEQLSANKTFPIAISTGDAKSAGLIKTDGEAYYTYLFYTVSKTGDLNQYTFTVNIGTPKVEPLLITGMPFRLQMTDANNRVDELAYYNSTPLTPFFHAGGDYPYDYFKIEYQLQLEDLADIKSVLLTPQFQDLVSTKLVIDADVYSDSGYTGGAADTAKNKKGGVAQAM
jgi:hypothetical protein